MLPILILIIILGFGTPAHAQWTEPVSLIPGMSPRAVAVGETLHVAIKTSVWTSYMRSPDNGETWTEPVVPADTFYDGSRMADIAYSNGLLHLAYIGRLQDEPRLQIFVLSSSDGGRNWWRRRQVFYNSSYGLKTPRVAVNGDTLFLSCRSEHIWVFRSLDNGETWSDSVMVESDTLGISQTQCIEYSGGNLHLVMPYSLLNDTTGNEVYYRRSSDHGLTWLERVALSTEEQYPYIRDSQSPSAASDGNGNVIAAWFDYKYGSACGVSGDILGRVSVDNGDPWLPESRLTYTQTGSGSGSLILNGVIHTGWADEYPNGCGDPKIMYSESRDWGRSWTEPEVVTGPTLRTEYSPLFVYNVSNGDTALHCFFWGQPPGEGQYVYYMRNVLRTGIEDAYEDGVIPTRIRVQAYPNPFNSSTVICFNNEEGGDLEIEIFNLLGQETRSFEIVRARQGRIVWDATDDSGKKVASGVYFVKATAPRSEEVISLVYLR